MENKPKCNIDVYGNKRWYINGKLHREDGPTIELKSGTKIWCFDGEYHRLDGPTIEMVDGTTEWWINDCLVSFIITKWAEENDIDLNNLTELDKALIKLVWSDYGK